MKLYNKKYIYIVDWVDEGGVGAAAKDHVRRICKKLIGPQIQTKINRTRSNRKFAFHKNLKPLIQ